MVTSSPSSIEGINRLLEIKSRTDPREAIRIREELINAGLKGTSLHLGSPTPEVIAQLSASQKSQNFVEKQQDLTNAINILQSRGVVLGNSSNRPELTQETAQRVFATERAVTQNLNEQVKQVLTSPEVAKAKSEGKSIQVVNDLLNKQGIAIPRFQTEIINELAQKEILGERQTAQNIQNILGNAGIVNAQIGFNRQGLLESGNSSNEVLAPIIERINGLITGVPTSDQSQIITDPFNPFEVLPEETIPSLLDKLLNALKSPLGIAVALIGFVLLITLVGFPNKTKMVITK